jgi:hypothetical protein
MEHGRNARYRVWRARLDQAVRAQVSAGALPVRVRDDPRYRAEPSAAPPVGLVIRGAGPLGVLARDLGCPLLVLRLDGVDEFPVLRP